MCTPYQDKKLLQTEWKRQADTIQGYHIHIYHEDFPESFTADNIVTQLTTLFPHYIEGVYNVGKVGPHVAENRELDIKKEGFAEILQWLQVNNGRLSILVHPETGDDIHDHLQSSIWINKEKGYNDDFFNALKARRANQNNRFTPK
jgi:DOPA 4,5-dioxygenase